MAKRLIDANALFVHKAYCVDEAGFGANIYVVAKSDIDDAPTVDAVEVVHGEWAIDEEDIKWGNSLKKRYCTNCGKRPHFDKENREFILSDYCPHCGAKMDGGKGEPMNNDLISRKALIEAYDKAHQGPPGGARKLMEEAPGVDAAPVVHGRWELVEYQSSPFGIDQEYQCSICGTPVDDENYRTRYCPNCGAKMDGGKEK